MVQAQFVAFIVAASEHAPHVSQEQSSVSTAVALLYAEVVRNGDFLRLAAVREQIL